MSSQIVNVEWKSKNFDKTKWAKSEWGKSEWGKSEGVKSEGEKSEWAKSEWAKSEFPQITVSSMELFFPMWAFVWKWSLLGLCFLVLASFRRQHLNRRLCTRWSRGCLRHSISDPGSRYCRGKRRRWRNSCSLWAWTRVLLRTAISCWWSLGGGKQTLRYGRSGRVRASSVHAWMQAFRLQICFGVTKWSVLMLPIFRFLPVFSSGLLLRAMRSPSACELLVVRQRGDVSHLFCFERKTKNKDRIKGGRPRLPEVFRSLHLEVWFWHKTWKGSSSWGEAKEVSFLVAQGIFPGCKGPNMNPEIDAICQSFPTCIERWREGF